MASQIAHIIYAKKYFDAIDNGTLPDEAVGKQPSNFNRDEFILGAVFPDIRRIDPKIKRKETHMILEELNLDFSYLDSFHAGWKFHLYADMKRLEILNSHNFFDIDEADSFDDSASKLLEDELVYGEYNNWEKLASYFNNPPTIEVGINVSRETFDFWYAILGKYVSEKPNSQRISFFLSKLPGLAEKSKDIVLVVDKLRQNDRVVEILRRVKEEII